MPRNPLKNFSRRKSANALDTFTEAPPQPSFRVIERPDSAPYNGGDRLSRRVSSGQSLNLYAQSARTKSADNLRLDANRSSAATIHSGSSGHFDASSTGRYSSTSTLPSSLDVDPEADNDDLYPATKAPNHAPTPAVPEPLAEQPPPTFAARAGRTFSFGGLKAKKHALPVSVPPPPPLPLSLSQPASPSKEDVVIRGRTTTVSSYASTAKPPQLDAAPLDMGTGFDNMFDGLSEPGRRLQGEVRQVPSFDPSTRIQEADEPAFSSLRHTHTPSPSPSNLERPQMPAAKRFSWSSRASDDQLLSNPSSDIGSPRIDYSFGSIQDAPSPIPGFSSSRGYHVVPDRYLSPDPDHPNKRQSISSNTGLINNGHPMRQMSESSMDDVVAHDDEDRGEKAVWRSQLRKATGTFNTAQAMIPSNSTVPDPISLPSHNMPHDQVHQPLPASDSRSSLNATPRAVKRDADVGNESLFDNSPEGPTSRGFSPAKQRTKNDATPRKMTRSQFELAQGQKQSRSPRASHDKDDASEESAGEEDDEDEVERAKELTRLRRRQEATMAVYRQQMKKVTGGQPHDLPMNVSRPGLPLSTSSMTLDERAVEEDDDDVPLGILQAHGFPNKTRPPSHGANPAGAPASPGYAGSVAGGVPGGNLPEFARRLPMDPYFGASLVNPSNRESLAFANRASSVYGQSPPPQLQAGGLVGIIAGEEAARAARRGSPNPITGTYGSTPMPANMHTSPERVAMNRSSSMASLAQSHMGGWGMGQLPGLPAMSPGEHVQMQQQQQMAQLMQMQQHMMQQMMAMQTGQVPMPMPMPGLGVPQSSSMYSLGGGGGIQSSFSQRPTSVASQAASLANQGRAMSMGMMNLQPPRPEYGQQRSHTMGSNLHMRASQYAGSVHGPSQSYAPSMAPSERSNVGMPSRYRPVSTLDGGANENERTDTPTQMYAPASVAPLSVTSGNATKQRSSTVRILDKAKGALKTHSRGASADDEDDEEGWAAMRRKREETKRKRMMKAEPALAEIHHSFD